MLARHQPATEFKQQAAGRPERRYHTGFTRFSQGKALLHLVHEPPEQRPSPARQLFDLGPGRDAHLTCRLAWVAIVRGVDPTWLRESSVKTEIIRPYGEDLFR